MVFIIIPQSISTWNSLLVMKTIKIFTSLSTVLAIHLLFCPEISSAFFIAEGRNHHHHNQYSNIPTSRIGHPTQIKISSTTKNIIRPSFQPNLLTTSRQKSSLTVHQNYNSKRGDDLGDFDPSEKLRIKKKNTSDLLDRDILVGEPQIKVKKKEMNVSAILQELAAIQQQGPRKYCILGTRHCSYLHQQIIELLSYALVLSENHVYTSGAGGTNAAAIKGALRAERPDLLTVILPQSLEKQPKESQELIKDVTDLITMPQNDDMSLDVASQLCNSRLLSETDQLIAFAFHESETVIEATREAKKLEMLVTMLYLD